MTTLGVFFTRGVSLKQWVESGLFDREVLIYREHLNSGLFEEIYWFTYGTADREVAEQLLMEGRLPTNIRIVPRPAWLAFFGRGAGLLYSFLMPALVMPALRKCDIFKTNQMDGAIPAIVAAAWLRRPLYVRTGYTLSLFVDRIYAKNPLRRGFAWLTEVIAFKRSSASSVSSRFDRDYVVKRYFSTLRAPVVVGNYIDIDAFAPRPNGAKSERLVFVGRLSPQKNLEAAITACAAVQAGLDIVGDGPDREALKKTAMALGADIGWLGVVANDRLPELLSGYRHFFLPSLWEGMPKALLEAMSSGLVCIGNNATGINEVIEEGVTGYLSSGPTAPELANAIRRAMNGDRESISVAGRDYVCRHFSLAVIAAKEARIFSCLLAGTSGSDTGVCI